MEIQPPNVLITGYFFRNNLGDDLFIDVYKYIMALDKFKEKYIAEYVSIDDLIDYKIPSSIQVIVLAGGDILNEYFLKKIKEVITRCDYHHKIIALSVGIPYIKPLDEGYLDFLNIIVCRSTTDTAVIRRRFSEQSIMFHPDVSVFLPEMYSNLEISDFQGINPYCQEFLPKVGIFLARDIYKNNSNYKNVVKSFAEFIDSISTGKQIFLIPFNTNESHDNDNDTLLNKDIFEFVKNKENVHVVTERFSVQEMFFVFKQLDFSVCMRYHAHMMSVVAKIPLFSVHTTGKVSNLLVDLNMKQNSIEMEKDFFNQPTSLDVVKMVAKFECAWKSRHITIEKYKSYLSISSNNFIDIFLKSMKSTRYGKMKLNSGQNMTNTIQSVIKTLVKYILEDSKNPFLDNEIDAICVKLERNQTTLLEFVKSTGTQKKRTEMASMLSALVCFGLIKISFPKYHYGMSQKILCADFNIYSELKYVWEDYHYNKEYRIDTRKKELPLFNAREVDTEHLKDCHRSGWNYVLGGLLPYDSSDSTILFDNFVDRTFHWTHTFYKYTGVIPFKQPWCGFVHHTTDQTFSSNNVHELFKNETFLESLSECIVLFTLSIDLEKKIRVLLDHSGHTKVATKSFVHPTEFVEEVFTFEKFMNNRDKKLVQIGGWLRDPYAIYKLNLPNKTVSKCALKGKNMDNYFKPPDLEMEVKSNQFDQIGTFNFQNVDTFTNKFTHGLVTHINDQFKSVRILPSCTNNEYDTLLSANIVFLNLVDASAVNTIIECIVRCTPVLVNRLLPLVEALGESYPFFYDDLQNAGNMACDLDLIRNTYEYMSNLDKDKYKLSSFIDSFKNYFTSLLIEKN